jgi:molybdenum cofactor cytidylyltransferase
MTVIPGVILAGGKSTRMGSSKALLLLDDRDTFLTRIIRTLDAGGVDDVLVVVGHQAEAVIDDVGRRGLAPRFVVNADYESGQLSSLLAGLNAVDRPGVEAMLLTLVDVPLVDANTVRAVLARYRSTRPAIVRPVDHDRHGHPIVIDRSLFDLLRKADPRSGAKPIIRAHVSTWGDVEARDEGAFDDIDTPQDYERLVRRPFPHAGAT